MPRSGELHAVGVAEVVSHGPSGGGHTCHVGESSEKCVDELLVEGGTVWADEQRRPRDHLESVIAGGRLSAR
jgi:hypothetical protein